MALGVRACGISACLSNSSIESTSNSSALYRARSVVSRIENTMSYGESVASSVVASSRSTTICTPAVKPALLGCAEVRQRDRYSGIAIHGVDRPAAAATSARHSIRAWARRIGTALPGREESARSASPETRIAAAT